MHVIRDIFTIDLRKQDNAHAHRTSRYETHKLVLRRGQTFLVDCNLRRGVFKPGRDHITLAFSTGPGLRLQLQTIPTDD